MTGDDDVVEAAMGDRVLVVLVNYMESWSGFDCEHHDRPQVAAATALRSTCWLCAWSTAAVESWAAGPCHVCGAAAGPADRVWLVPLGDETAAVKLCKTCAATEVRSPTEGTTMTETTTTCCAHCLNVFADLMERKPGASPDGLHKTCATTLRESARFVLRDRTGRIDTATRAKFARGYFATVTR